MLELELELARRFAEISDRIDKVVETFGPRDAIEGAGVVQALLGLAVLYGRTMGLPNDKLCRWLEESFEAAKGTGN